MVSNLILNGSLLSFYIHHLIDSPIVAESIGQKHLPLLRELFASKEAGFVFRPSFAFSFGDSNFFGFIFDLHARAFIFGIIMFLFIKMFGVLEEYLQFIPYKNSGQQKKWYDQFLFWAFGVKVKDGLHDQRYERTKICFGLFGLDILKWFRDGIYHPWAHITKTNRKEKF